MSDTVYDDADKPIVVEWIKNHVETNKYCSVKYAAKQAVKKQWSGYPDHGWTDHEWAFVKSVAAMISESGEYIAVPAKDNDNDFDIKKYPGYKTPSWSDTHPFLDKLRTGSITAAFSLIVGIILWLLANQKQGRSDNLQDTRMNTLSDSIKTLQTYIKDSVVHLKTDTGKKKEISQ